LTYQILAGVFGFLLAFLVFPSAIKFARKHDLMDHPDGDRRVHSIAVPRIGGMVVLVCATFCAFALALTRSFVEGSPVTFGDVGSGLLIGAALILGLGLADDMHGVSPPVKLVVQTIAALIAVGSGFVIQSVALSGTSPSLSLGPAAPILTIIWIVGMTNAFNLIDGVDGLAGTFALIGLIGVSAIDLLNHGTADGLLTAAAIGAVFAFLRFNNSPARVFLGDAGSMTLGFLLSVRATSVATTSSGTTFILATMCVLAYPLTDTAISMTRRWLRGHPLSRADGRHVHHQILALGASPRRVVEILGFFFAGVAAFGICVAFAPPEVILSLMLAGGVAAFLVFCYGVHRLDYSEFTEVARSMTSVLLNARRHVKVKVHAGEIAKKIEHAGSLTEVHRILETSASDFDLLHVELIPRAPQHHGPQGRQISPLNDRPWRVEYPITWNHNGSTHEVMLRLWCAKPRANQHLSAERIATRLAPAVENWVQANPQLLTDELREAAVRVGTSGRRSGQHQVIVDSTGAREPRPARSSGAIQMPDLAALPPEKKVWRASGQHQRID
jgi:UDP-GlcNAc:undecaprenyl-phosphate GlcNAc-1-phosphate transferase